MAMVSLLIGEGLGGVMAETCRETEPEKLSTAHSRVSEIVSLCVVQVRDVYS